MQSLTPAHGALYLMLGIFFGSYISEDAAVVAAAALAATHMLGVHFAFLSAVGGVWTGDLGVYALLNGIGGPAAIWFSRKYKLDGIRVPRRQSLVSLGLSRFVPGTRLPSYAAAVVFRTPFRAFAVTTAISATVYAAAIFIILRISPNRSGELRHDLLAIGATALSFLGILAAWRKWGAAVRQGISSIWHDFWRWEFWPAWVFYLPVGAMCAWLAFRFRGIALPTAANPGQHNGGLVGESKWEILRDLMVAAPDFVADGYLVGPGATSDRVEMLDSVCCRNGISYPLVLKPDVAQRGAGFRKIHNRREAEKYLAQIQSNVVLQRYVSGPKEAGIFYYRFPGEAQGHIFSITRKEFPCVVGDGIRSLQQLILSDRRARRIARTYFERFAGHLDAVPPPGLQLRLVEAGNHCQGCIFRDGSDLNSEELRSAFDSFSQAIPGFFIGRFDVRYSGDDALRQGKGFKIIELNGAASEATSIYDERYSLWSAYKTLYEQWKLVYAIGAANIANGHSAARPLELLREWRKFRHEAICYPIAD
jgi:membrane protein DedA with SNARE-associated domain